MISETGMFPSPDTLSDADYEFLRRTVYELSHINLGSDKRALVSARVGKRLRALKLSSYSAYCQMLKGADGKDELGNLVDAISTNHTHFFREESHFDFLRNTLLPARQANSGQRAELLRVWSAACSSGEEPYTLAIVLAEFFHGTDPWHIEATDISTRILARAEAATYEEEKVTHVKGELLRRHFQRGTGKWEGYFRVKEALRQRITFRHLNLLQPAYPFHSRFHVIFCRNVMIYFDRATQEKLVAKFTEQLEPGGHLIVGHSESLGNIRHTLRLLAPTIYQKAGANK